MLNYIYICVSIRRKKITFFTQEKEASTTVKFKRLRVGKKSKTDMRFIS